MDTGAGRDARLVEKAKSGDEDAFSVIYRAHRTPLLRFAWRMTGSAEIAEDVTQECFLLLIKGAGFDAGRGSLRTYLFGMARNLVFRSLRVAGRESDELAELAGSGDALDDLLTTERSILVQRAIASLPPLQREAIVLFEYEELSLEQIAAVTRGEIGAVKARLQRARESLRKRLAPVARARSERSCT